MKILATLTLFASCCAVCQTPLAFEAASVKPNTSGDGGSSSRWSPGQITCTNIALEQLIIQAYNIAEFQLSGPEWLGSAKFDIAAKYPAGTTAEQRPAMLRTLLAERFHLAIHRESKMVSAFALVVAKEGPKLVEAKPGGTGTSYGRGRIQDTAVSVAEFAGQLARELGRPVADKTGLTAAYNLKLVWTPDDAPSGEAAPAPSIFAALQEQLGLKLQTERAAIAMIVVDHVDRAPAEN